MELLKESRELQLGFGSLFLLCKWCCRLFQYF